MNYEWIGKAIKKKFDPKNGKIEEIKVKLLHVYKKLLPRKRNFVQTPFSHSTLKIE